MKLSELVAYRNQLNRLHFNEARTKTDLDIITIRNLVATNSESDVGQQMQDKHNEIHQCFDQFKLLMEQAKLEVQEQISIKEQYWLEETYRLYTQEMVHDSVEHILNRRPVLSKEHDDIIRTRIKNFSNNLHPAMIVRPGQETFLQTMVSFDPLYLVDQHEDMLFPSTFEFPEQYRRRLRPVIVDERDFSDAILHRLPDNQFAMCLAYNFFEFKPMPVIERWLEEIFAKLKPGGKLMMTFNDCDNEKAVRLAENYYACYTPGRLVRAAAQRIGYEIYFTWNDNVPTTWLELSKPGTLTTLRGGQALARIHQTLDPNWTPPKPMAPLMLDPAHEFLKDCVSLEEKYDPERHDFFKLRDLKQQALSLNLTTPEEVENLSISQLEEVINDYKKQHTKLKDEILTLKLLKEHAANRMTARQLEQILNIYKNNQKT